MQLALEEFTNGNRAEGEAAPEPRTRKQGQPLPQKGEGSSLHSTPLNALTAVLS